jgi:hypothetical protein
MDTTAHRFVEQLLSRPALSTAAWSTSTWSTSPAATSGWSR